MPETGTARSTAFLRARHIERCVPSRQKGDRRFLGTAKKGIVVLKKTTLEFILLSTLCLGGCLPSSRAPQSGDAFAEALIDAARFPGGEVKLQDALDNAQFCFAPTVNDVPELLQTKYGNLPVIYRETDDSNKWYVIYRHYKLNGVVVLGISHGILRWNDYSSNQSEDDINIDKRAMPVCGEVVIISYFGNERIPTFRPKH